jgi:2-C-methyl-D-erythritol 2,4-cyclodiphosphate synthase
MRAVVVAGSLIVLGAACADRAPTAADVQGAYRAELPATDRLPARTVTLRLDAGNAAEMTVTVAGAPRPVVEVGTWSLTPAGDVRVVLARDGFGPVSSDIQYRWARQTLTAIAFDTLQWGGAASPSRWSDRGDGGRRPHRMTHAVPRIGIGYDSHTFGAERPLVLAGVSIAHDSGLTGHSDGDAVAHAVTDAVLGAAALGDIGALFPDTDPQWRGADSMRMLATACERVRAAGFAVANVDVTVVTQRPRLVPHVPAMRERLAAVLGVAPGSVSVKGKTNEGMDAVGRGEGLQVFAVALLLPA